MEKRGGTTYSPGRMNFKYIIFIYLISLATALNPVSVSWMEARAAYEKPTHWSEVSTINIADVLRSSYASYSNLFEPNIQDETQDLALNDRDGKISAEFHIPKSMRGMTRFWFNIYTKYTTRHVAIIDSVHPEIEYEVIDFRELAKKARNEIAYEITKKKIIKSTLAKYRVAFTKLGKMKKQRIESGKNLGEFEGKILKAHRSVGHKHSYSEYAKHLRTQTGQRDNVIKGLIAAETLLPQMELIFNQMKVPPELTRLSLVESSFEIRAYSRAGATGIWQFMPASARKLLKMDVANKIDERLSPLKSTVAAARLLKSNHQILRSWSLAVTAYNHGFGKLKKIGSSKKKKSQEIESAFSNCDEKSGLGWASRNYYAEFLAVLHAEAYYRLFYGEIPKGKTETLVFRKISKPQTGMHYAVQNGLSIYEFRINNPDIRDFHRKLPKGFWVAVPDETQPAPGEIAGILDYLNNA